MGRSCSKHSPLLIPHEIVGVGIASCRTQLEVFQPVSANLFFRGRYVYSHLFGFDLSFCLNHHSCHQSHHFSCPCHNVTSWNHHWPHDRNGTLWQYVDVWVCHGLPFAPSVMAVCADFPAVSLEPNKWEWNSFLQQAGEPIWSRYYAISYIGSLW